MPCCRKGDKSVDGSLDVRKNLNVGKNLNVCKNASIRGNASIGGDLSVKGTGNFNNMVIQNRGSIIAEGYVPNDNLTLPIPDGPYAVDHFQIGKDNVQIRTPVKFRVDQVPDLQVTNVEKIVVDGVEYFGRMVDEKPVYLSYPLPLVLDVYVPSTRTNKDQTNIFFPDETSDRYASLFPLNYQLLSDASNFNVDNVLASTSILVNPQANQMNYIPDEQSLGNLLISKPLSDWNGLQDKFLLDDPNVSAFDRIAQMVAILQNNLNGTNNQNAYILLCKIIGSYGVPVEDGNPNSVRLHDRLQAYNLVLSSSNYTRFKNFKTYAPRHGLSVVKDASDIYQPKFNFDQINVTAGKPNVVLIGDPTAVNDGEILTTKLASWGIAGVIYNLTYNFNPSKVPGKLSSAVDIITRGNAFPDIVSLLPRAGNYAYQASDANNINGGYIFDMGYNYDYKSTTGTSSLEFNQDTVQAVLDTLRNTRDVNNNLLSTKLNLTNRLGTFGRSGGSNGMSGAHMINMQVPRTFSCGVAFDIVMTIPYTGFDGTKNDFQGGSGYSNDVLFSFPGGLNYPILFIEPEIDWYSPSATAIGARVVVGARKSLQNLIRKTQISVRARTIFMQGPNTGHADNGPFLYSNERAIQFISGKGILLPDKPKFPDIYKDPVYGFSELSNNRGNISQALLNAMVLYHRTFLSNFENISAAMFNLVPFKFDQCPWDLPDADDYQWPYRFYRQDVGGAFNQRLSIRAQETFTYTGALDDNHVEDFYTISITDPTLEIINVNFLMSKLNGQQIGDADIILFDQNMNLVGSGATTANPEYFYYNLENLKPEDRLGDWTLLVSLFEGQCEYKLDIELGHWKLVFDSQSNYENVTKPALSLNNQTINVKNIPTSSIGLKTGDIWSDNGALRIVS